MNGTIKTSMLTIASLLAFCATGASAAMGDGDSLELLRKIAPSAVVVEYTLQYDEGQTAHEHLVADERPLEKGGMLLTSRMVISADPLIDPRFVKEIHVRRGDDRIPAKPIAYARDNAAVYLEMDGEFETAVPLEFDPTAKSPYSTITMNKRDGRWILQDTSMTTTPTMTLDGGEFLTSTSDAIVVNNDGVPVGMMFEGMLPSDDSWKGSPLSLASYSQSDLTEMLRELSQQADAALVKVTMNLRSPRRKAPSSRGMSEDDEATVIQAVGVLVEPQKLLVLANIGPAVTARLERIIVSFPDKDIDADFAGSLNDYGCLVANLKEPRQTTIKLADVDVTSLENKLLLCVRVLVQGEQRVTYLLHNRISGFGEGWRSRLEPAFANADEGAFYFLPSGELVVLPAQRRLKVSARSRYSSREDVNIAAREIRGVLSDLAANCDPNNAPLSQAQEGRLAWLGVELQPLDRELARVNNVAHLTSDGETGGIVSYVYPESPADKAGLRQGDIILRLHVAGEPKPIELEVDSGGFSGAFPWDRLDEIPEQYYDQVPTPWASAENSLTRALTDLGFGRKFNLEYFRDNKLCTAEMEIVQSPEHYESAQRFASDPLGLTVRDLTYEARRYFQRMADQPGVIISNITPGSKASVAGLKPFEIVTHVNDSPVNTIEDFKKALEDQKELRFTIVRMMRGRTVKILLDSPAGM
ncbi:MAG: hypothetical protein GXY38_13350 [Planctomycetes bacterium]|jgi:hypothetical protein|nr:hypothetical protein [Planctomycetota bacterium]